MNRRQASADDEYLHTQHKLSILNPQINYHKYLNAAK